MPRHAIDPANKYDAKTRFEVRITDDLAARFRKKHKADTISGNQAITLLIELYCQGEIEIQHRRTVAVVAGRRSA